MIEQLRQIVQSLSKTEESIVKRHLNTLKTQNYYDLFLLLKEKKDTSIETGRQRIMPDRTTRTFERLLSRFKRKLYDLFTSEAFISADSSRSAQFYQKYVLRKDLIVAEMMISKGLDDIAISSLAAIEIKANEFELFHILYEATCLRAFLLAQGSGYIEYHKLSSRIEAIRENLYSLQKVDSEYLKLIDFTDFADKTSFTLADIRQAVLSLNELYYKTGSEEIYYYYVYMNFFLLELGGRDTDIINIANELLDRWQMKPQVSSLLRVGAIELIKSDTYIRLGEYQKAIESTTSAADCYDAKHFNHNLALDLRFFAQVYTGKLTEARSTINAAIRNTTQKNFRFHKAYRKYYRDCLQFLSKKKHQIPPTVYEETILDTHVQNYSFYIRLLIIMNQIELGRTETAEACLDKLIRFMQYQKRKNTVFSDRKELIVEVLKCGKKTNFKFEASKELKPLLELLSADTGLYRWEPQSPEVILFHEWVRANISNMPYRDLISSSDR